MRTLRASRSQGTRPRPIHASAGATVAFSSPARGVRHEFPLPPDEPRHQVEVRTSLDPDVLGHALRVRRPERRREDDPIALMERDGVPRRIEPELFEPDALPLVATHHADRRGDVHEAERSEEHTSELQSPCNLVCRLLLEKKKKKI